jgi:class I fructose-bisphosphate aldolase
LLQTSLTGGNAMIGKKIRMERIFDRRTGKTIIVPMDHGVSEGPIEGLYDLHDAVSKVAEGGANAIIEHKGMVEDSFKGKGQDISLIIHLSASTKLSPGSTRKNIVCTVEEALSMGADAVSIHVNLGVPEENAMLTDFGIISRDAKRWGLPLLAMMYAKSPKDDKESNWKAIRHAARVGAELGADIIKVAYSGEPDSFHKIVKGCPKPIVIAGGPKADSDKAVLEMVKDAMDAGAAGLSIGRNVFQHKNPKALVTAFAAIIHHGADVKKALSIMEKS